MKLRKIAISTVAVLALVGCSSDNQETKADKIERATQKVDKNLLTDLQKKALNAGFQALPSSKAEQLKLVDNPNNPITEAKVELGKKLYFDPRLSKSNLISCNTCHNLAIGGVDIVPAAIGHGWTENPHHLNSPTVYNAVFADKQFWDGRAKDLEEQAQGPIQAPPEMNAPKELVVSKLKSIPEYVEEFKKVFNSEITFENATQAIAAFERTLITPSRFDKFLQGDNTALTDKEKKGLEVFIDKGCASCHTGIALGGTMQPFPAIKKYKYSDVGDFKGDKNSMVKTPTLRNILETAPYFHNGAMTDIKEAVNVMAETQLGIELKKEETENIVEFFKSLTGEKPKITYPILPAMPLNN